MSAAIALSVSLLLAGFVVLCWRRSQPITIPMIQAELAERVHEVESNPIWSARYEKIVNRTRARFPAPDHHVWGQYVQGGNGYAVFVATNEAKSCITLRSTMTVNEKVVDNDIFDCEDLEAILVSAWNQTEKALREQSAA